MLPNVNEVSGRISAMEKRETTEDVSAIEKEGKRFNARKKAAYLNPPDCKNLLEAINNNRPLQFSYLALKPTSPPISNCISMSA